MNTYVKLRRYSCAHRFPKFIQYFMNIASVPPLFCFTKTKTTLFKLYWKPESKGGVTLPWQKKVGHCLNLNKLKLQMRWSRYKTLIQSRVQVPIQWGDLSYCQATHFLHQHMLLPYTTLCLVWSSGIGLQIKKGMASYCSWTHSSIARTMDPLT